MLEGVRPQLFARPAHRAGPARERPYKKDVYHTFKWRGWYDFGTGALGDMACHTANLPFMALKLGSPTSIAAPTRSPIALA